MSDSPTPSTTPERRPTLARALRLPRLSGKASAAFLVGVFLVAALLIPAVVRLPLWIDFEIVLAIWWLGWLVTLTVLLYRGQRVTDDHQIGQPRNWLGALKGDLVGTPPKEKDTVDIRKKESGSGWSWLQFGDIGPVDGEGCAIILGIIVALVVSFFLLWFLIEIAIPVVVFLLYAMARNMLAAVVNDRHRCRDNLGRALTWGLAWATLYTAPLAGLVWFVHYVLSNQPGV